MNCLFTNMQHGHGSMFNGIVDYVLLKEGNFASYDVDKLIGEIKNKLGTNNIEHVEYN